jgi:hypothetical protein
MWGLPGLFVGFSVNEHEVNPRFFRERVSRWSKCAVYDRVKVWVYV